MLQEPFVPSRLNLGACQLVLLELFSIVFMHHRAYQIKRCIALLQEGTIQKGSEGLSTRTPSPLRGRSKNASSQALAGYVFKTNYIAET